MPLYFFVTSRNKVPTDTTVVLDLPDASAAWEEATKTAGGIIKDLDGSLRPGTEWAIQVQDAFHSPLRTLRVIAESNK